MPVSVNRQNARPLNADTRIYRRIKGIVAKYMNELFCDNPFSVDAYL